MSTPIRHSSRPRGPALLASALLCAALGLSACANLQSKLDADAERAPTPQADAAPRALVPAVATRKAPDLVVIGAVAFAPAPEDFDQKNPILPTLAERLTAQTENALARATGDAWAMAILCRMPATLARLDAQGQSDLRQPDLALLTRAPTPAERTLCAEHGVALESVRIARYLGGLEHDAEVEGAWIAYSAARIADFPEKRALIDRARLLIGADAYSKYFAAL